ncbi:MAG: glutamine synthetase III [Defluviitaleaceae bacterium]|nr:glutamine synthetase III [Defluviitaleaceae bacterium]MCL2274998.1 glutamine synthetase III [Defluviitaleaceae bacterium]
MKNSKETFGTQVFNDAAMQARLPQGVYKSLKQTIARGAPLAHDIADIVANAMKEWAVEQGATHFTHWFQPMTGITAEKHEAFLTPKGGGRVILSFSGAALVRGEPDASSLPSGGLRATFEARGYTVWDTTSYAFIKEGTLYIPTAFCGYNGEALDMKTPLLRSMEALNTQALRILRLFGNHAVNRVRPTVGAEQEYFLIDKDMYRQRPDLVYCGRTLFGGKPPKGQELGDHYFGKLLPRVSAFMTELDAELWKLGVYAKTKHNEVAPAQHELAPVFTSVNVASDHNQLTMELLQRVADRHNLACLLHEKPFAGLNGSGKHVNWSLTTDTGTNLFEPGETPHENAQFLLFLVAAIQAVDEYADILRAASANPGNDHRLNGFEAPSTIISMFLGTELTAILEALEAKEEYQSPETPKVEIGVTTLPHFPRDTTDRNRTSPFAFTGNKFEFRMPGASTSVARPSIVLNTAMADVLSRFADTLESAEDFKHALDKLVRRTFRAHKRIVYNGNNYATEWHEEAHARGLSHLPRTVDALPALCSPASVALFARQQVFTETELTARCAIHLENYAKTLRIEASTLIEIVKTQIIPACFHYQNDIAALVEHKIEHLAAYDSALERHTITQMSTLSAEMLDNLRALEAALHKGSAHDGNAPAEAALHAANHIAPAMEQLRKSVDALETITAKKHWPLPTYGMMLYSVG